ncbi:hypothetical protein BJD78_gp81 [Arthrobacter phage KellEzio]|uniref:Uncharacterized protein n=1 Tax=Arthrobacter phage KellEzio TaxID=1796995 RepID=A0A140G6G6_9CAUD|nr:hypothetical protein BJD78_gp81 [Arthrobacter phage KellEzio]AMM44251.1 hypothetical protein KELLEZIO_81 [Arthrobacter phage KellEzio]
MTSPKVVKAIEALSGKFTVAELQEAVDLLQLQDVAPESGWAFHTSGREDVISIVTADSVQLHHHVAADDYQPLAVSFWHGPTDGVPVIQIDGEGQFRINVNDAPIWDADPSNHQHTPCRCTERN